MAGKNEHHLYKIVALCLVLSLIVGALNGCKKEKAEPNEPGASPNETTVSPSPTETSSDPIEAAASLFREPKANLKNIIDAAKTWQPSFEQWWGKLAPDFTLTDIEGNVHKLSNYRGKNVVVVMWATWCGPCQLEIPHLKELQNTFGEDKLVILSISNESPALLKEFASNENINYTILSGTAQLPAPFGEVKSIPSSFYVDPEGKFKLATTGLVPAGDAEAIVRVQ